MSRISSIANGYIPKILVVDDESRIRTGCCAVLQEDGYEVACAASGPEGLQMIADAHFDVVLLDLMMPELSGLEVLPKVKAAHPDTAVIVITGYATLEHSIEAMKSGAFDFIPKPFSPDQLKVVVEKAIAYTRALQDIAKEKSRMRGLINRLSDGVMATDNRGCIVLANPSFQRMMGVQGKDMIGRSVDTLVSHAAILKMIDDALTAPADAFGEHTQEISMPRDDQDEDLVLNVHCAPFKDRSGLNVGSITVLHDITTLKEMDRMKSDFVSMVSHEIRSPMNSVLMQLKVVLDGLAGEVTPKQKDILARASERIRSLVDLATDLLDLAKIESRLITLEKEPVPLNRIIEDQIRLYAETAAAAGLVCHFTPQPDLPPLLANRVNMEELVSNLISNAIKYTPKGGNIRVAAFEDGGDVCITVKDDGLGIAAEDLDRIFDRFYRIKNKDTRSIAGTGLGLSIVKRIVEAHDGTVAVESKPNQGSVFRIKIPLRIG